MIYVEGIVVIFSDKIIPPKVQDWNNVKLANISKNTFPYHINLIFSLARATVHRDLRAKYGEHFILSNHVKMHPNHFIWVPKGW